MEANMSYPHILVAVDFSEGSEQVVERARDLAQRYQADLSLIHVVENIPVMDPSYSSILPFDADLTEQMVEMARNRLNELGERLGITENRRWVELGSPKSEIIRIAEEQGIDLIVLGSHGRHGIGLLLGSTASSVVHHAGCDILAVRLKA
jgi:universal stress protein A